MGTHTYVILEITQEAYDEIRQKLEDAGYTQALMAGGEIDMHGLALKPDEDGRLLPILEDDPVFDRTCPLCGCEQGEPCISLVTGCEMTLRAHEARGEA